MFMGSFDWLRRCGLMVLLCGSALSLAAASGILQIREGYFWDPGTQKYFVPRGVAYQTWNPPVGAHQSFEQVEYDLTEFKKIYANSVRCEFVWSQVEVADDVYDWSKPDYLIGAAEKLGLKLFVLIGFQYPPTWFPENLRNINDHGFRSDVLNYEHPEARKLYADHIRRVTERYKESPAIGGWILGNEYAYFDLWEPHQNHRFIGYDPISQQSFRQYLAGLYQGNIAALNANWGTGYANFDSVLMPERYPENRDNSAYTDLIRWRQKSIGDFVALGAVEARKADPNHLITYSMVGGIFSGNDANHTCEDAKTIVTQCVRAGAPLDFWSINNYAWSSVGNDLRSADFGIGKYQEVTGLPIMISETGHSSTENLFEGAGPRQAKALPGQMWEALLSGAIGVHFFHWSDRNLYTERYFLREKGFGIVHQSRLPKIPVYAMMAEMFRRMQQLQLDHLLGGSQNPKPDVYFFWSASSEMGWPRANQENAMLWGALRRAGFQPGILDDERFDRRDYTNGLALVLSRCFQMQPRHLDAIENAVLPAGVHVHANADLPGQFNDYHQPNANWIPRMNSLFGLDVRNAAPGLDLGSTWIDYLPLNFSVLLNHDPFMAGATPQIKTWKWWHGVRAVSGSTVMTHRGMNDAQDAMPALQIKNHARAKTAITTFAMADTFDDPPVHRWEMRSDLVRAIYRTHFGMVPAIELSGPGATYVLPDYRICRNGSVLISLLNEHTSGATVTLRSPSLLQGKTVENLTSGGILERNSDGLLEFSLEGDDYLLLYVYSSEGGTDQSMVSTALQKVWFHAAPNTVWPREEPVELTVGFDTQGSSALLRASFEQVRSHPRIYGEAEPISVSGKSTQKIKVPIPDANIKDPFYRSSREGSEYFFRVWLESGGRKLGEARLPVRLLWGVRPRTVPDSAHAGENIPFIVDWEELPGFLPDEIPTPIHRAELWDSMRTKQQNYNVVVELKSGSDVMASDVFVTSQATGQHEFLLSVPPGRPGPFTLTSYLETAAGVSDDFFDSFEGRGLGAETEQPPGTPSLIAPWVTYTYPENGPRWLDQGSHPQATRGSQSAFVVVTNPPAASEFAGFGIYYRFAEPWMLPADTNEWNRFSFACDFKEKNRYAAVLELQVKSGPERWIQFTKPYIPGSNDWDRIEATLADFVAPEGIPPFDPTQVDAITVNIRMLDTNVIYIASFDHIRFDRPERIVRGGTRMGYYTSANDFVPDSDGDGIVDPFETGTGIYVSATDTGTDPDVADTDGDGQMDGRELLAGTDPTLRGDVLGFTRIERLGSGEIVLAWRAVKDRLYDVQVHEGPLRNDASGFVTLPGLRDFSVSANRVFEVNDAGAKNSAVRFYRLVVRPR
ncbi:MAG: beta-galactosidase [Verrucomicrobiota bacterium]